MALSLEELKQLVELRPYKREIARGTWHQNRLKFHTQTTLTKDELSQYYTEFIHWIGSEQPELLPSDKIERFKQLITCPLPTVELTESISTSLSRVFDAQDALCRYDIEDPDIEADWDDYRDDEFWKTCGVEAMMNAIDSVWVVDFGKEDDKPTPKDLLIDIGDVIDLSVKDNGDCNHVIFQAGEKLFVYDDEAIAVYEFDGTNVGTELSRFEHELGYCPAKMFWSEYISRKNRINHKSPLTNVLGELDYLLAHLVFKKYMDIANSFPILVAYSGGDDYTDLTREENIGRTPGNKKTAGGAFVGPGTVIEMPVPMEGQPDLMANPVKWIAPEVETLRFHSEEGAKMWDRIYASVVGIDGEQENNMAKNEKQVLASFESQSNILRRIAHNFELIWAFADRVKIQLRYGIDVWPVIDLGSKFFLKTTSDLVAQMEDVKSSDIVYDALHEELLETKFRSDTAGKTRADVILDLDPLPGRTIKEAEEIQKAGGITSEEYQLKARMMSFVRRFEREQLPLNKFVMSGDYSERLKLIKEEFKKYESEFRQDSGDQGERSTLLSHEDAEDKDKSSGPDTSDSDRMDQVVEI